VEKPRPFSQDAAILRANESFYRAFSAGDYAAMERVWAARAPVSCLHPGLPALVGRENVMQSWRQILAQSAQIVMRCDHARVQLFGESAIVTCYEGNGDEPAHLAATNVFVREAGEWRMVHHHAGPLARAIARPASRRGGGGGGSSGGADLN
jgi:ketosteroid isomerase-like protein